MPRARFFLKNQGQHIFFPDLLTFSASQIYGGDFAKLCGFLRIYELYMFDDQGFGQ